jgi:enoyl-CoA hydratase/carnithine racemase
VGTRLLAAAQDALLLLTLDSNDGYPRLRRETLAALNTQIERLSAAPELIGAVITGTERAFAAGADIEELAQLTPAEAHQFSRMGQQVFRAIDRCRRPVLAAIRGYCMGGGLDLALACCERVATPDAVFAHPGGALGILTGWGGTQRLPRLIGRARAMELLATGRRMDAQEALSCGLVSRVVPSDELMAEAIHRSAAIAAR